MNHRADQDRRVGREERGHSMVLAVDCLHPLYHPGHCSHLVTPQLSPRPRHRLPSYHIRAERINTYITLTRSLILREKIFPHKYKLERFF